MPKLATAVNPATLPKPSGFSHAFEVQGGKTLYLAGQVARSPSTRPAPSSAPATSSRSSARCART